MSPHLFRLLNRHQRIDDALRFEQARNWPNVERLRQLRTLKAAIRDRLDRLILRRVPALAL